MGAARCIGPATLSGNGAHMVQLARHCTSNTAVYRQRCCTGNTVWDRQHCIVPLAMEHTNGTTGNTLDRQHCIGPATLYCITGNEAYKWYNWQQNVPATHGTGRNVVYRQHSILPATCIEPATLNCTGNTELYRQH